MLDRLIEFFIAVFIVAVFVTAVFPELSKVTGQSTTIYSLILSLMLIAIAVKLISE